MIRNFLSRVMYGRYGTDQLNLFLLGVWVALYALSIVFHLMRLPLLSTLVSILAYLVVLLTLFRMLSRNYERRRRENEVYLEKSGPIRHSIRRFRAQRRDKEHKYFRCPTCGAVLRVPRMKGKVNVTCRTCGTVFQKKL
jgi:uncharacterized C2H2 Zn-finger protein